MLLVCFSALVCASILAGCLGGEPPLSVSVENPVSLGYTQIRVSASEGLTDVSVRVGDQPAVLASTDGKNYVFNYFVSPYSERDPLGVRTVEARALNAKGDMVKAATDMNVSYFAIGDNSLGVTYYYLASPPTKDNPNASYPATTGIVRSLVLNSSRLNFVFEMDEGGTDRNAEIINAFSSLVSGITSKGVNLTSYAAVVKDGRWLSCVVADSNSTQLSDCERVVREEPCVLLRLPDYPSSQVYVHEKVVELQPAKGQTKRVISSLMGLLSPEAPQVLQPGN
jgi:hypothetical protein